MRCLPALLLVLVLAHPVGADPLALDATRNGGPRVRPNDARMATLLLDGLRRSPSLLSLVERIEASDVIVYLETQPALSDHLAGCLTWITSVGRFRYVRASINPNLTADALIASIGHELQHVVEIIDHPDVTGPATLFALYQDLGRGIGRTRPVLDTIAARDAGSRVRDELRTRVASAIPGGRQVSPRDWHAWYRQQQPRP